MNAMAKVMAESSKTRPDIEKILGLDEPPASSWFQRRRSTFIVVVLLAVGLAALLLWTMAGSKGSPEYVTKPVTRDDITVFVSATGTVQPINQVDVSSEQSGTVRKVYVDFNSQVTKDQSLAELDTDKLQATVDSARAKLLAAKSKVKEAEATVTETELELQRKQNLVERRISSAQDLDTAKAAYDRAVASLDSAKADVAAAEADLKLDETNLSKAIITSPINGIVLSRDIEPGQTVAASLEAPTLFTLAEDLSQMEVQVDVDEADVGQVKEKQNATFTVDAYPERTFSARIRSLRYGSETVQNVVTYKAVLTTDNADLLLRPGMTATANIKVKEVKDAITVPNAALRFSPPVTEESSDGRSFLQQLLPGPPPMRNASSNVATGSDRKIWVLENGQAREVAVKTGASDGKRTEIVEGDIKPGQAIIVDTDASQS